MSHKQSSVFHISLIVIEKNEKQVSCGRAVLSQSLLTSSQTTVFAEATFPG